jgi:hypothetical protein
LFSVIVLSEPKNRWRAIVSVPAQAYFLTAAAIVLIPSSIRASMEHGGASQIAGRLSLLSGVLLLAVVGGSAYRRWYLPAGLMTAAIFFGALYRDVGREARVEAKMQELVQALPAGERVVSYLSPGRRRRAWQPLDKRREAHALSRAAFIHLHRTP